MSSPLSFIVGDALHMVARHVFCLLQSKGRDVLDAVFRGVEFRELSLRVSFVAFGSQSYINHCVRGRRARQGDGKTGHELFLCNPRPPPPRAVSGGTSFLPASLHFPSSCALHSGSQERDTCRLW